MDTVPFNETCLYSHINWNLVYAQQQHLSSLPQPLVLIKMIMLKLVSASVFRRNLLQNLVKYPYENLWYFVITSFCLILKFSWSVLFAFLVCNASFWCFMISFCFFFFCLIMIHFDFLFISAATSCFVIETWNFIHRNIYYMNHYCILIYVSNLAAIFVITSLCA